MKVEDLMIGDLILYEDKVIRVDAVHKRKIGYHKTKDKLTWLFCGQFKPIPLTPEILKKNGILYEKSSFYYAIKDDEDLECTYYIQQVLQGDWIVGVDIGAYDCSVLLELNMFMNYNTR